MAVSLQKGQNVNLSKTVAGLQRVVVGLGWDVRATDGAAFDLDASAFMLKDDGRVPSDQHFVFFNQPRDPAGAVEYGGDNRTGQGAGDDEKLTVDLSKVPAEVKKVSFCCTIYDADTRRQSFGQVNNAYIRIVNANDNTEIARFDLSEDASTETAMVFGELYTLNGEWKFKAVGQGFAGGLKALAQSYGVDVG